ncbi:MAG: filamentous hemagglutinin N-terminal domain-containing protein [Phycisphaerales bacterium]
MRISRSARRITSGRVAGIGLGKYVWVGGGLVALLCMQAIAGPEGENVVAGSATFQRNGASTLITTGGPSTIIDYRSFNIASNEIVRINQPSADSRVLNRVPNSVMPTRIDGQLSSNGIVYIANAQGVYFGNHAIVNAAGVYAAAGQITNQDFLNNVNRFTSLAGDVINKGDIIGGSAGVALLGRHVANSGSISAPEGLVAMASGDSVYFTELRGHMMVEVTGGDAGDAAHGRANVQGPSRPGVENSGRIAARQTRLQSGDLYSLAIRMPGEIRSQDVVIHAAGEPRAQGNGNGQQRSVRGGGVDISGIIDATSTAPGGVGGSVQVLGDRVSLRGASIDASGSAGGGSVKIGGDYQGGGDTPRARHTRIDHDSAIRADAIDSGNGGRVIVWSDLTTGFAGDIFTRGGAQSGDGGFVEVSSRGHLSFTGHVDTSAPNGNIGQLLLDPTNILIVASGGDVNNFNQVDQFADNDRNMGAMTSSINASDLNSQMATVTLQATNNITFQAAVNMTNANAGINAQAGNNITVNSGATITTNGGPITFEANSSAAPAPTGTGSISINAAINTSGAGGAAANGLITLRVTGGSGSISVNSSLTSGSGGGGGIVLDITGGGTGSVNLGAASPITLSTDGASISFDDPVVITGTTTIDTERGNNSNAGSITFTGGISANGFGHDLTLDTSTTGAFTAGDISLGSVGGSVAGYVNDLMLSATGGGASGVVTLAGDVSLDASAADTGDFAITGALRTLIEAASVTIDTEQGNDGSAGSISLAAAPVSTTMPSIPVLNLTASTSFNAASGGAVSLGLVDGSGGGFLNEVNITTAGGAGGAAGTTTLSGNISVDSNGGDLSAFSIGGGGLTVIAADLTIDTEQVDDGSAGHIDLSGTTLTANSGSMSLRTLMLNTETTETNSNAGNISLGGASAAGSGGGAAAINSITIDMAGGASGSSGVLSLAGSFVLDGNGAAMDLADFTVNSGAATLLGNTSITTEAGADGDAGSVTFGAGVTIDGAFTFSIDASAGAAGDINLSDALGSGTALAGVDLRGDQIDVDDVRVSGNALFRANDVNFNGSAGGILGTGMASTLTVEPLAASTPFSIGTVTTPDTFSIDNAVLMQLGNFAGGLIFGRSDGTGLATVGDATFANPVTIRSGGAGGSVTLEAARTLTTAAANRAISLQAGTGNSGLLTTGAGSVIAAGAGSITLTADSINLLGGNNSISSTSTITLQPASPARPMVIAAAGAASDFALSTTELANITNGSAGIFLGRSDSSGPMTISAVTFQDPVTFRAPAMGGSITVNGLITGTGDADIAFSGSSATTTLNADIVTAVNNDISFDDSVILGVSTVNLTTSGTGFITFNGKIDGTSSGGQSLVASTGAAGSIVFFDNVGSTTRLGSVDLNAGTVDFMSTAQNLRTTGAGGDVDLTGVTSVLIRSNLTIDTSAGGAAGDILFGTAAIDTPAGPVSLNFDAIADGGGTGGAVSFGTIGAGGAPFASSLVARGDSITLNGNITTAGAINFGDTGINAINVATNVTLDNTAGANAAISLRNLVGNNTLNITADSGSALSIVGADLDTLMLTSGGTLSLSGLIETDTAQNFSSVGNIVLLGATTLTAQDSDAGNARRNITLGATNDVTGAFGLTVNGAAVSIASIGQGGGSDPTSLNVSATTGATITSAEVAGQVDVTSSAGDITIDTLDAGSNAVNLTATAGLINEADNDAAADVTGSTLTFVAAAGIGSLFGGIETSATSLSLTTTGAAAHIVLNDTRAGTTSVTAATTNGDVTLTDSMGDILVNTITAGTGGAVSVTASAGRILDNASDSFADITTTGAATLVGSGGIGNNASGSLDLDVATLTSASSTAGDIVLNLLDGNMSGVTINQITTADGNVTVDAPDASVMIAGSGITVDTGVMNGMSSISVAAPTGTIDVASAITADDGAINLSALDMTIGAGLTTAGNVTLAAANSGSIGVGAATVMGGLNVSNAELVLITADMLTISTTGGNGDITIDAVAVTDVMGINLVKFLATGGDNQITFSGAASQFQAMSACADNGVFVNVASVPMTTIGSLTLDGDADNSADMGMDHDSLVLGMGVMLESTGDLTLNAANGAIVAPGAVAFTAGGALNLGGPLSVGSLMLTAADGITISQDITSAGTIDIDADSNSDGNGTLTVDSGAMVVTNNADISINAADLDLDNGRLDAGGGAIALTVSDGSDAHLGGAPAMGDMNISAAELLNVTSNGFSLTTDGDVTVDAVTAFNPGMMTGTVSGLFSISAAGAMSTITFQNGDSFFDSLSVAARDLVIDTDVFCDTDFAAGLSTPGTLGIGDAMGDMSISKAELALIHADNATFGGANVTQIFVDNVAAADVMGITGLVTLDATRNDASITFQNAPSIFRRLTAVADDGIALSVDLSTTIGDLRLDADADDIMDTAGGVLAIADGVTLTSGIAMVLDATSGGIQGAGVTNLNAVQGIIINDSLSSAGTLTINSDTNADGVGALTFLGGTTNSTSDDNISITAANVFINGTLDAGMGSLSIVRSNAGAARLGGTDPGIGVLWLDSNELSRLTCLGFTFGGAMATLVEVDGVSAAAAPGISGTSTISALGNQGRVEFINNDSSFRALNVQANDGVAINRSLSTTQGLIQIDADANMMSDSSDTISVADSVNLSSATGISLSAPGGLRLDGAFGSTTTFTSGADGTINLPAFSAPSGSSLTINSQGDVILNGGDLGMGTLVVSVDSDNDGANTLSLRGNIAGAGNVLFSAGGVGAGDTIELFFDINSDGAIVLQNADTVTIGSAVAPNVNLNAGNGSLDIFTNIGAIRLDGPDMSMVRFMNSGGSMSFAPIVATNDANLQLTSTGVASIRTIDLNNGSFTADAGLSNIGSNLASIEAMNITINRDVTTQMNAGFSVIVNNAGAFTTDPAAVFNLDGAFTQSQEAMTTATVNLGGSITTSNDNISFASPLRLRGTGVTLNTGAGSGDISFADSVDSDMAGPVDLTLTAGTGNVSFAADVGAGINGLIDTLTIQSASNVTFSRALFANSVVQTAGTGTTRFAGTLVTQGAGGIDLNGNIFFFDENAVTINGTNGGFSLTNSGDATFATGKSFEFEGAFIQDGPGRVILGSNISTGNDAMSFAGPITINSPSELFVLSTGGGNMSFANTVNDTSAGAHFLRLDAGGTGDIAFTAGSVGVTNAFGAFRAQGRNLTVREIRTVRTADPLRTGDITLLPLLTLTDVDPASDVGAGVPGSLAGQDLRPNGIITINGNLVTTGGGRVRIAQSVDGSGMVDNDGHTINQLQAIPSVATVVFGDVNGAGDGTFTINSSGDVIFGRFSKVAVFGTLNVNAPGRAVTISDITATDQINISAATINLQSRPPAFLVDPTNLIGGQLNRMSPDNGPSIVARTRIMLSGNLVNLDSFTIPTFGSTSNNDVIGAVGFVPISLATSQIPTAARLRFNDPDRGLTALTVNSSGVGNFGLASALASALPRENRFEVGTDVTVGKAQLDVLLQMSIFARELSDDELQTFLRGLAFYNDTQRALSRDASAEDFEVTVNRLYPPLVDRLVGAYLRVFFKPTTDPATGEEILTIQNNAGKRSAAEIKDILSKALSRFMGDATGAPDPVAFRDYLETAPGEEQAHYIVQNLGEFLTELKLLGLGPREEANARKAVFDPIRPSKFTSLSQFELLLTGQSEPVQ